MGGVLHRMEYWVGVVIQAVDGDFHVHDGIMEGMGITGLLPQDCGQKFTIC